MERWSRIDLFSTQALLESLEGNASVVAEACQELAVMQESSSSFCHNPVSTAMALLALTAGARGSEPWARCLNHLLDAQKPDGTWRFCTCDIDFCSAMQSRRAVASLYVCVRHDAARRSIGLS